MTYCQHCITNEAILIRKVMTRSGLRDHWLCAKCSDSVSKTTKKPDDRLVKLGYYSLFSSVGRPETIDEIERRTARVSLDRSSMLLTLDWVRPPE